LMTNLAYLQISAAKPLLHEYENPSPPLYINRQPPNAFNSAHNPKLAA
jgi:hypothetical protein